LERHSQFINLAVTSASMTVIHSIVQDFTAIIYLGDIVREDRSQLRYVRQIFAVKEEGGGTGVSTRRLPGFGRVGPLGSGTDLITYRDGLRYAPHLPARACRAPAGRTKISGSISKTATPIEEH
jgi:hypothetical protein